MAKLFDGDTIGAPITYEQAYDIIEVVDYDIAKSLSYEDPDEMLDMALNVIAAVKKIEEDNS